MRVIGEVDRKKGFLLWIGYENSDRQDLLRIHDGVVMLFSHEPLFSRAAVHTFMIQNDIDICHPPFLKPSLKRYSKNLGM